MSLLTLASPPRFAALQRPTVRDRRDELPLRSAPLRLARRTRKRTERGSSSSVGVVVASSALDNDGVASTSTSSTSASSSSSSIADAKASLRAAAPAARGGDPASVAAVLAAVERLAELAKTTTSSSPYPPPPEPSVWETLYTDAKQGSNGKVGPLQGEARQLFTANKGFINRVSIPSDNFPLLRADFTGRSEQRRLDRDDVIFEKSDFYLFGGLRVAGSTFPPPPEKGSLKGHWNYRYIDDEMRIFVTNKLSVVVLGRVEK